MTGMLMAAKFVGAGAATIGVAGSGAGSKLQLNCNLLRIYGSHKSVIGTVFGHLIIGTVFYSTRSTDASLETDRVKVKITYQKHWCAERKYYESTWADIKVWDARGEEVGSGMIQTIDTRDDRIDNSIIVYKAGIDSAGDIAIYISECGEESSIEARVLAYLIASGIKAKRGIVECDNWKEEFSFLEGESLEALLRDKGYIKEEYAY